MKEREREKERVRMKRIRRVKYLDEAQHPLKVEQEQSNTIPFQPLRIFLVPATLESICATVIRVGTMEVVFHSRVDSDVNVFRDGEVR